MAVLRDVLDDPSRAAVLSFFEQEVALGRVGGINGREAALPYDHPAAAAVRAAASRAALDTALLPAYHELAVVRRYTAPYHGFRRHCDNADAMMELTCGTVYAACLTRLRQGGLCPRNVSLESANLTLIRRHFPLGDVAACRHLPRRCLVHACERRSRVGCSSVHPRDWPEGFHRRLPKRHTLFRAMTLSLVLDQDFDGGDLNFWSDDGVWSWTAEATKPGDALLFDAGVPHAIAPITRGVRTVLLYWFHTEPWGANPASLAARAYTAHVWGLTNEHSTAQNTDLKLRLYCELELQHSAQPSGWAVANCDEVVRRQAVENAYKQQVEMQQAADKRIATLESQLLALNANMATLIQQLNAVISSSPTQQTLADSRKQMTSS
eukprot:TRINITY_DN27795_c0_g1_i1.p1 TRINITY_DN27795_c0_g1~~TRINITY_DN27795_c0_g1_i1.p1  ORF type:complete len:390 (-),score=49.11 TRINITY_DN27795_c0_g1_i1:368-1507(-)